jgi:KaiC/GvpD/RAD55 family RecA-like ATPase
MAIKRISTGVKGLDKLIEGGVPEGSTVLVTGAPGTGKTIMALQFIAAGVKEKKKCAYVAIEQPPAELTTQAEQLGLNVKGVDFISAKDIKYDLGLGKKPEDLVEKIRLVLDKLNKAKPARVVIDSVSSLQIEDGFKAKLVIKMLFDGLKKLGATSLVVGEALESDYPDEITPFLADGMIVLRLESLGSDVSRTLTVRKMRLTNTTATNNELTIDSKKGIIVKAL